MKRNVGTMNARCHDLLDRMVPAVARVPVLTLRPDVFDLVLHLLRGAPQLALPAVVAYLAAGRCGPNGARDELQQLGFPGTIRTGQHPSLTGTNGPAHIIEHSPPATIQADVFESHLDVSGISI